MPDEFEGMQQSERPKFEPLRAALFDLGFLSGPGAVSAIEFNERGQLPPATGACDPDAEVRYVFGDLIARGGMGSVLEAYDRNLGRKVAAKVMIAEMNRGEPHRRRFVNEAAVLARLTHPNIVPIYDLGRDREGQLYYSMKRVQGSTLQAILDGVHPRAEGAMPQYSLDRLLTILRKVCDAMAFAHSRGIIHRDLKPDNIMVGEFGEVLVMDWGLAKQLNDQEVLREGSDSEGQPGTCGTLPGAVMGTPQYMSPEQADGRISDIDERTDIFSLGAILYAILTLRPPVEGETLDEVLRKVSSGEIKPPSSFASSGSKPTSGLGKNVIDAQRFRPLPHCPGGRVPEALSAVAMKALALKREQRYENVTAFNAELEAYQNGFATSAEGAGAWKQVKLFLARHKPVALAAVVSLALLGIMAAGFAKGVIAERDRAVASEKVANQALAEIVPARVKAEAALVDLKKTAPTFYALARTRFSEGKLPEALEQIGYALKLDDSNPEYRLLYAETLAAANKHAEAVREYRRALDVRPSDARAQAGLAVCTRALEETRVLLDPERQLVGWWRADGDARDIVGFSHGTLVGGAGFAPGKMGQAFSLNGTSACVSMRGGPAWTFGEGDFTLAFWVNLTAIQAEQPFLASGDDTGDGNQWTFRLSRGHLQLWMAGAKRTVLSSPYLALLPGKWHHLAVTRNGPTLRFFVDGNESTAETWSDAFPTAQGPLVLGHREGAAYLHGLMDDIRIYHRGLAASEIRPLAGAAAASAPKEPKTKASQLEGEVIKRGPFQPDLDYLKEMSKAGDMDGILAYLKPAAAEPEGSRYLVLRIKLPAGIAPWDVACLAGGQDIILPESGIAVVPLQAEMPARLSVIANGCRTLQEEVDFGGTKILKKEYLLGLLLPAEASAFSGRVLSSKGIPVPGAIVRVCDWGETAETGGGGAFNFPVISPGHYHVRAESPGGEYQAEINLVQGERFTQDLVLRPVTTVGIRWAIQMKEGSPELAGPGVRTGKAWFSLDHGAFSLERGAECRTKDASEDFGIMRFDRTQMNGGAIELDRSLPIPAGTLVYFVPNTGGHHSGLHREGAPFEKLTRANRERGQDLAFFPKPNGYPVFAGDTFTVHCRRRDCYAKLQITGITSASGQPIQPYPAATWAAYQAQRKGALSSESATPVQAVSDDGSPRWDAAKDWSIEHNPSGPWSYGCRWALGGHGFDLMPYQFRKQFWLLNDQTMAPSIRAGPLVWARTNESGFPVVRFTCPETGTYRINSSFDGYDNRGTDVLVYVIVGGRVLFSGELHSSQERRPYEGNLELEKGAYVDFAVKWDERTPGGKSRGDWTRIRALISRVKEP